MYHDKMPEFHTLTQGNSNENRSPADACKSFRADRAAFLRKRNNAMKSFLASCVIMFVQFKILIRSPVTICLPISKEVEVAVQRTTEI